MKKIFYIFIFFTYSCFSFADTNQQKKIDDLFDQLKIASSYEDSKLIESKIWELWTTHPSENSLTALLADGSFYMSQNKLETAYETFTKTIELDSNWAEAWNKRATVLYLMGKYELSQADIDTHGRLSIKFDNICLPLQHLFLFISFFGAFCKHFMTKKK